MQTNTIISTTTNVHRNYDIEGQQQEQAACPREAKVCAVFTAVMSVASLVVTFYGVSEFADGITYHNSTQAVNGCWMVIGGLFGAAISLISCECLCCC